MRKRLLLNACAAVLWMTAAQASAGPCAELLPEEKPDLLTSSDTVTPEMLIRLRDIGPVQIGDPSVRSFGLSPDGRYAALNLLRADPVSNAYCSGVAIVDLVSGRPQLLTTGGDYMMSVSSSNGFAAAVPLGVPLVAAPGWSPDGLQLAYLRRDGGVTQLWTADMAGHAVAVTAIATDVETFAWSPDARTLIFSTRPGLKAGEEAIREEGKSGYLYDDRWLPASRNHPLVREPVVVEYQAIDIATKHIRPATAREIAVLVPAPVGDLPPETTMSWPFRSMVAWTAAGPEHTTLNVRASPTGAKTCGDPVCDRVLDLWWLDDGKALAYLRNEDRETGRIAVYVWKLSEPKPRRLIITDSYLTGCQPDGSGLMCLEEASVQPNRLVAIDLNTGSLRAIFDPNPEFARARKGKATRFVWTNAFGIRTFGDLVLPPDHRTGERHPLIVVQYHSRGFLRGGTGNEIPIQAFAAKGYAVLSVQRPAYIGDVRKAASSTAANQMNLKDWADRRSVQSTLELGVKLAVSEGVADPARAGLTGLSDGASTAQFVMINSKTFTAVSVGTCCDEESAPGYLAGPVNGRWLQGMGYPKLTDPGDAFWAADSFRRNASAVRTPLLMQLPDDEYLAALEAYTALTEQGAPAELYVYPDETHIKWQPAHKLAIYQRNLDWFDFWLKGTEDPSPGKAAQYRRWEGLRQSIQDPAVTPGK